VSFIFIDRQHQLDLAVSELQKQTVVAIYTESSSFYTYDSELCLIQISSNGHHYLLDALAKLNLSGLGDVFADAATVKVMHTAA